MTDRELLELAAKAAGNEAQWDCPERGMMILTPDGIDTMTWNPLTDDGDALRLAVKLDLRIEHTARTILVSDEDESHETLALRGQDHNAATRRAIVMTASEISKAQQLP